MFVKLILSYFAYALLWTLGWLPLPVLYLISDLLYPLIHYVIGYRKKVVRTNLANAFPEKSEAERKEIERKFYRHFCDLFVEVIKLIHISPKQIQKRMEVKNNKRFEEIIKEKPHGLVATGHYTNWEWAAVMPFYFPYLIVGIYKPLKDRVIEKLLNNTRTRFGAYAVPMHQTYRAILKYREENISEFTFFVTDQAPVRTEAEYFTRFLNQETSIYLGIEKLARKFGYPVYFLKMTKIRRGHYVLEITDCCPDPLNEKPYAITEKHVKMLEEIIREKPEYWLWSHRRWKYGPEDIKKQHVVVSPTLRQQ